MSITLGNSIQIKGQCYKNGIEISTEDAIQEILEMGRQEERDRIRRIIKDKALSYKYPVGADYIAVQTLEELQEDITPNLKSNDNTN